MTGTISLPHREQEWLGGRTSAFDALTPDQQSKKIKEARALIIAIGLTKSIKNHKTDAAAPPPAPECILDTLGLTILAIFIRTCGLANATTFLTDYKASDRARKSLAQALVKEAFRYATAPMVRPTGPAPVDTTITLTELRLTKEANDAAIAATIAAAAEAVAAAKRAKDAFAAVAAEVAVAATARDSRIAAFVPPPLTAHTQLAYNWGLAGEWARLSPNREHQKLLESGRKLVLKSHWRHLFTLLTQHATLIHKEHLEKRIDRHVNRVMDLDERVAAYEQLWQCPMPTDEGDAYVLKWKRARDTDSWGDINEMEHGVSASYDRCAAKALMVAGIHILVRKWWKQPKPRAAAIRAAAAATAMAASATADAAKPKKYVRLTTAEKAARHTEVIKQLLPKYLVARDISTFTKPIETIQTVRLGNLREARGDAQVRDLNKDIRTFVERNGGVIAQELGAVFVPLNRSTRQTQGYCFVKLTSPTNARIFLERIGALTHAMLIDSKTGEEREVFPELAASDRKTKEQMEAEKAKAAAAKRSAEPTAVDSVSAAIKAAMRGPGAELKPICLAAIKAEKMSAAEQALKDKIAASFPSLSSAPTVAAKQFEVSFAAAAAKPLPEKVEVIDPFKVKLAGVEYALAAAPTTDIGRAQMALRQAAEDAVAADERRKARAARRSEMVEDADSHWMVEKVREALVTAVAVKKEEVQHKSFQEAFRARLAAAAAK